MVPIAPTMPKVTPMMVLVLKSEPLEPVDELLGGGVLVDAVGFGIVSVGVEAEEEGILTV